VISRIDNVGVACSDLERSLRFYEALGFGVRDRDEGFPAATLAAGEATLYLFQAGAGGGQDRSPELAGNPPGLDHLSLWVGDVDRACAGLREAGLRLESEPADQPWGARAASLLDPDGTRLYLLGPLRGQA
jgi:catechol 2,3-dioxygenase-like lactoylglutathione lyase family enzyme